MRILSATIERAHYARDFGQVEATVALLVKDSARPVPYVRRIFTTEPARGGAPPARTADRQREDPVPRALRAAGRPRRLTEGGAQPKA